VIIQLIDNQFNNGTRVYFTRKGAGVIGNAFGSDIGDFSHTIPHDLELRMGL
jgi:hypothetical protein